MSVNQKSKLFVSYYLFFNIFFTSFFLFNEINANSKFVKCLIGLLAAGAIAQSTLTGQCMNDICIAEVCTKMDKQQQALFDSIIADDLYMRETHARDINPYTYQSPESIIDGWKKYYSTFSLRTYCNRIQTFCCDLFKQREEYWDDTRINECN